MGYRGNHNGNQKMFKTEWQQKWYMSKSERYSALRVIYILTYLKGSLKISEISFQIKKLDRETTKKSTQWK